MDGDKHTYERDTRDARYDSIFLGEVVENDDPEGWGRIRVKIPGIVEPESRWAFHIGRMFGVKEGIHWVPRVGANVVVWFLQGNVDHPYYAAGPFGAPGGESDIPDQAPAGSVDHLVIRWKDMHLTLDGTDGAEKVTIEDLTSGTKLEIDKTTGNYLRDVEGDETVNVKGDRNVTVEEGDESHTVALGDYVHATSVGNSSETVGGDKTKVITGGEIDSILGPAGKVETVAGVAGSTETIPSGPKTITAGLAINLTAGAALIMSAGAAASLTAAGLVSIQGVGVNVSSVGGAPTNNTSAGLVTNNFLGGMFETITGALTRIVTGIASYTYQVASTFNYTGLATFNFAVGAAFVGTPLNLGAGPTYKAVINLDLIPAFNGHTHDGVTAGGGTSGAVSGNTQIVPGAVNPTYDQNNIVATNVFAS